MNTARAQFDHSKAWAEGLIQAAQHHLATMERVAHLNLAASKAFLEDGVKYCRGVLGAKSAEELIKLGASAAESPLENAQAYLRGVYEVLSQNQSHFTHLVEAQAAELNKRFESMFDQYAKDAPSDSAAAVAAIKSAFAAANAAYDAYRKVAKRTTELAEAQFTAYEAYSKVVRETSELARAQFNTSDAAHVHKKAA